MPRPVVDWDHNATTPLRAEVRALLREGLEPGATAGGNPSSVHGQGRTARKRLDAARARVAQVLGCEPREVCFTASGTEADAIALQGAWLAARKSGRNRVVVSAIEHPAVLAAAANLELLGAEVVRVPPGPEGRVEAGRFLEAVGTDAAIASLMWANNETGVLQPVAEVARACRQRGVPFHTDAVQAAGKVPLTLREVDADLLSLSGHKLGAPVGAGVLVVRRGVALRSVLPGHQEDGARGGTQAVWLIEAFALALALAQEDAEADALRVGALRDRFERELQARVPGVRVNGARSAADREHQPPALRRRRRRGAAHRAGSGGDLCLVRRRVRLGQPEALARAAGDGADPGAGPGEPALLAGTRGDRGRGGAGDRRAGNPRSPGPRGRARAGLRRKAVVGRTPPDATDPVPGETQPRSAAVRSSSVAGVLRAAFAAAPGAPRSG